MEYHEGHRSWSTCCKQRLFVVCEIFFFLSKHPSRKLCSFSDLCLFCLLSSTKSVPMYLVTCWKYKQSHIFISPCRNEPSQLQNCRTQRFFTVFGTLLVTWRELQEILSPAHPKTEYVLSLLLQVRTFHSVWYVRHCTVSTVVPRYGLHLVYLTYFFLLNF